MDSSPSKPGPASRKPTPAEVRRAAKNERKQVAIEAARKEAAKRRQRNALFGVLAALIVVGVVIFAVTQLGGSSKSTASLPGTPGATTTGSAAPSGAPCPSTPPTAGPANTASTAPGAFPVIPSGASSALKTAPVVKGGTGTVSSLKVTTLIQGTGAVVKKCDTITVNYTGVTYKDGKAFDSSWSRKATIDFQIGNGKVIPGWDQGLVGVKVGSRVQLDIPTALAYGADAAANGEPAGDLRFVVDILGTKA